MKKKKWLLGTLHSVVYANAPGGLTMYWAIIIGVIVMSGYLVGGLVPQRNPPLGSGQELSFSPPAYKEGLPVLQLGSMLVGGCKGQPGVLFLIDSSESMNELVPGTGSTKLDMVKNGLLTFTSKLTDTALVGVVTYSEELRGADPKLRFGMSEIGDHRDEFLNQVTLLGASGETYFKDGMVLARDTLARAKREHGEYTFNLIVISDSIPVTVACQLDPTSTGCLCKPGAGDVCFAGVQDPTSVAAEIRASGVNIYTLGIYSSDPSEMLYKAEYEKMLADIASQPLSRYSIIAPNASSVGEIMGKMGRYLCLENQNSPVLATPTPTPSPTPTPTPTLTPTPTRVPTPTPTATPLRSPADVMLVLDTSHSMESGKLDSAKVAANAFIDIIAKNTANRIGIAAFDNRHGRVVSGFTGNFAVAKGAVSGLSYQNQNNLGSCLECVIDDSQNTNDVLNQLQTNPKNNRKIVIILSDGGINRYVKNNNPNRGTIIGGSRNEDARKAEQQAAGAINLIKNAGAEIWVIDYGGANANYLRGLLSGQGEYRTAGDYVSTYQSIATKIVYQ